MENYRVIEIKQSVFADNDQDANRLLSLIHISEPTRH